MSTEWVISEKMIEDVEREYEDIISRSTLDKYIHNPAIKSRFIEDLVEGKKELSFEPGKPGFKVISGMEYDTGLFDFFSTNRKEMEDEFKVRFDARVDASKYNEYVDRVCNIWTKGQAGRKDPKVQSLMQSVYDFIQTKIDEPNSLINKNFKAGKNSPFFTENEVQSLLGINYELLDLYLGKYCSYVTERQQDASLLATSDLWFHRGLYLSTNFNEGDRYKENDILNSYSTSVSVTEMFAQISPGKIPVIISTKAYDLIYQVFAFYAFIPNMTDVQTEIITIPVARKSFISEVSSDSFIVDCSVSHDKI
jgi:hypothetical protein